MRGHAAAKATTSAPAPATTSDATAPAEGAAALSSRGRDPEVFSTSRRASPVSKEEDTASPFRRASALSSVGTSVETASGVVKPVRGDPGALGLGSGTGVGVGAGRGESGSLGRRRTDSDHSRSAWSTPAAAGAAASAATTPSHAVTSPARMVRVTSSGGTEASAFATREAQSSSVCPASSAAETVRARSSRPSAGNPAEGGVPRSVFRRRGRGRGAVPGETRRSEPRATIADARRRAGSCEALGARFVVLPEASRATAKEKVLANIKP